MTNRHFDTRFCFL